MFCHKCGSQIENGQAFCHKCGTKVVYAQESHNEESIGMPSGSISSTVAETELKIEPSGLEKSLSIAAVNNQTDSTETGLTGVADEPNEVSVRPQDEIIDDPERAEALLDLAIVIEDIIRLKCPSCGAVNRDGAKFCFKCGADITNAKTDIAADKNSSKDLLDYYMKHSEKQPSKLKLWWESCSKGKKALIISGIVAVAIIILALFGLVLLKIGLILIGLLLAAGFLFSIFTGSKEDKREARKSLVGFVVGILEIALVVGGIVAYQKGLFDESTITDLFMPGASVRYSYLTQYSSNVTIEDAFNGYFSNGKWSTYKDAGYKYVVFTGNCFYMDELADARITFKVTGDHFVVDSLEINGVDMGDFMLYSVLENVYEKY